jgi:adenylate cyclase
VDPDRRQRADRTLSLEQLARETHTGVEQVLDLQRIGVLSPSSSGLYTPGDVLRVRTARTFLDAGVPLEQLELAIRKGLVTFEFVDRFYTEPPPPSGRTYEEFRRSLGPLGRHLPGVYQDLGLAEPGSSSLLSAEEEAVLAEFLEAWSAAGDHEAFSRAARLIAEAARLLNEGWNNLFVEKLSLPPGERESIEESVQRTLEPAERVAMLAPRMFVWLQQRLLEQIVSESAIEGLEAGLAAVGAAPPPPPTLPAIAFVDLSGYTRLTEERGDEQAVRSAVSLHEEAERCARRHRGRLVKMLGDGAMLRFPDPSSGVRGALDLVETLSEEGLAAHAGVHAGPVIERDRDVFGRTVNVAARIAGEAGPGEVMVSDAVARALPEAEVAFEPTGRATLKGIGDPVTLFRAHR